MDETQEKKYKCLGCDKVLKSEKHALAHWEKKHPYSFVQFVAVN